LLLHKILPVHRFGRWDHAEAREVGWVTGACLVVRREVVEQVGSLDPGIFMFYEDLEWCLRLRRAGWQVWYCPAGRVTHLGGQSTRKDFSRMLVISQGSQYYLYHKHFSRGALHLLRLLTVVEVVLRSLLWGPLAAIRTSRRVEARQRLAAYGQILRRTLGDRSFWDPAGITPRADSQASG
jgi:GT2 family glycosyltransferase